MSKNLRVSTFVDMELKNEKASNDELKEVLEKFCREVVDTHKLVINSVSRDDDGKILNVTFGWQHKKPVIGGYDERTRRNDCRLHKQGV